MRRRAKLLTVLILLIAVVGVLGGLWGLVQWEPRFYRSAKPAAADDDAVANEVITRYGDIANDIRTKPEWGAAFSAADLNAFFRRHVEPGEAFDWLLPPNATAPRVHIESDRLTVAATYKPWGLESATTIISLELRAWLVKDQINAVAVELISVRAGALPIGSQSWLDAVTEAAREKNIEVTWYRHDGHPVGVFKFFADQPVPTTQIRTVRIASGSIAIVGRTKTDSGRD